MAGWVKWGEGLGGDSCQTFLSCQPEKALLRNSSLLYRLGNSLMKCLKLALHQGTYK
jgi:hypothetical protein